MNWASPINAKGPGELGRNRCVISTVSDMPGAHTETRMTSDFVDELRRAVLTYVSRAAERLREQQLLVGALYVFVETNPFREDCRQYSRGITIQLPHATDDTLMLAAYTRAAIDRLTRRLSVQEGRHHADRTATAAGTPAHACLKTRRRAPSASPHCRARQRQREGWPRQLGRRWRRDIERERRWKMQRQRLAPPHHELGRLAGGQRFRELTPAFLMLVDNSRQQMIQRAG